MFLFYMLSVLYVPVLALIGVRPKLAFGGIRAGVKRADKVTKCLF